PAASPAAASATAPRRARRWCRGLRLRVEDRHHAEEGEAPKDEEFVRVHSGYHISSFRAAVSAPRLRDLIGDGISESTAPRTQANWPPIHADEGRSHIGAA